MKTLLLLALLSITIYSCNCHHEGSGYVYDATTKQPLPNVRIEIASNVPGKDTLAPHLFTNAKGYFNYSHDYCADMVSVYKEGYRGHTLHPQGDTIFLEVMRNN